MPITRATKARKMKYNCLTAYSPMITDLQRVTLLKMFTAAVAFTLT